MSNSTELNFITAVQQNAPGVAAASRVDKQLAALRPHQVNRHHGCRKFVRAAGSCTPPGGTLLRRAPWHSGGTLLRRTFVCAAPVTSSTRVCLEATLSMWQACRTTIHPVVAAS
jgi:hypothetical protein